MQTCDLGLDKEILTHGNFRMTAMSYQKGGLIKAPKTSFPPLQHDVHRDKWSNYPLQSERIASHNQCCFNAFCDLSMITYDLDWSLFGDKERKLNVKFAQTVEDLYNRLREWYMRLPKCLGINNVPPHVLSFQCVLGPATAD